MALPGGDLLVLSPKDRLLLRIDRDGDVVATGGLDMELLPQPEAMTLLPDGRLLIGSEGRGLGLLRAGLSACHWRTRRLAEKWNKEFQTFFARR